MKKKNIQKLNGIHYSIMLITTVVFFMVPLVNFSLKTNVLGFEELQLACPLIGEINTKYRCIAKLCCSSRRANEGIVLRFDGHWTQLFIIYTRRTVSEEDSRRGGIIK